MFYEFSSEADYDKILWDFSVRDLANNGACSPQRAVSMEGLLEFGIDKWLSILDKYMAQYDAYNKEQFYSPKYEQTLNTIYETLRDDGILSSKDGEWSVDSGVSYSIMDDELTDEMRKEIDNTAVTGININNDGRNMFAQKIADRLKGEETRETPIRYIGKDGHYHDLKVGDRIAAIATGRSGKGMLVAYATVSKINTYNSYDEFHAEDAQNRHLVPVGSKYDFKQGGKKYGYEFKDVTKLDTPIPTKWNGPAATRKLDVKYNKMDNDSGIKYSFMDVHGSPVSLSESDTRSAFDYVSRMASVATLFGNKYQKTEDGVNYLDKAKTFFDSIGGSAYNDIIGEVRFPISGIRHVINNKLSKRKSALTEAIPSVISNGKIVYVDNNHNNKGFDTILIAAPVLHDGIEYMMGVVVRQDNGKNNGYYMHDAICVDIKEATQANKYSSAEEAYTIGKSDSIATILTKIVYVKQFNKTKINSFSRMGNEYMELANKGEANLTKEEKASMMEMVVSAAIKAGYDKAVYHGTSSKDVFNVFKSGSGQYGPGVYFTYDKGIAGGYGRMMNLFVKADKIADYDDLDRILGRYNFDSDDEYARSLGFSDFESMVNDWENDPTNIEANPAIIDKLIDEGFVGFADEGNDGFVLWPVPGFKNLIKSADLITYDDNGNIIPLDERFNAGNPDIRWSRVDDSADFFFEQAEAAVSEERKKLAAENEQLRKIVTGLLTELAKAKDMHYFITSVPRFFAVTLLRLKAHPCIDQR